MLAGVCRHHRGYPEASNGKLLPELRAIPQPTADMGACSAREPRAVGHLSQEAQGAQQGAAD